jgi:hypothetical protein
LLSKDRPVAIMSSQTIQISNETTATSSRITKEGKKITYRMNIIQQPERARACGSGAKSSADRRPVDPPPIVELRLFEGENAEHDITFTYQANFFIFAHLSNARHPQPGRAATPNQPNFPVLTGTHVAGIAYLDRPSPAGYFIFPDLSVRHEGRYRLGFSLYEELKEGRDYDSEVTPTDAKIQESAHVSHRLEVKSTPFTVFSAKKFPGLASSTALSRMVAEQGCRVRIRRDVRMRRRDTKADYDGFDDGYERPRQSATPDAYNHPVGTPHIAAEGIDRPRSVSDASHTSYAGPRRPSMEHVNQAYQQQQTPQQSYPSPMAPHAQQGMYPAQAPQWHQQHQPQQAGYMQQQQQQQQQQPPHSYAPQQSFQQPAPPMNGGHYNGFMPPQYPTYEQQNPHMRNNSVEFPAPPTGPPPPVPQMQQQQQQYPSSSQPMKHEYVDNAYHRGSISQAPLQPLQTSYNNMSGQMQPQYASAPPSAEVKHDSISPYAQSSPAIGHSQAEHQPYYTPAQVTPPKFQHAVQASGATKRSYSSTFDTSHMDQPLRQGARPPQSPTEPKFAYGDEDEATTPLDEGAMSYRRADGTERRRRVPINA